MRGGARRGIEAGLAKLRVRLERQLGELVNDPNADPEKLNQVSNLHLTVVRHQQVLGRRKSLSWMLALIAVVSIAAGFLSLIRLNNPDIVLDGVTSSLIYRVGAQDDELLSDSELTSIFYQGSDRPLNHCLSSAPRQGCLPAEGLLLQSVVAFMGSTVRLRQNRGCSEIGFLEGGGLLLLRILHREAGAQPPDKRVDRSIRMGALDSVRYCGPESNLVVQDPGFVILGDSVNRVLWPAAAAGEIFIPQADQLRKFGPTDIVKLEELEPSGILALQREANLKVTISTRAGKVQLAQSERIEDLRPTWLETILGLPWIKASLGLMLGIWSSIALLRAKFHDLNL